MTEINAPIEPTTDIDVTVAKCHRRCIHFLTIDSTGHVSRPLEGPKGIDLAHETIVRTTSGDDVVARPIDDIVTIIAYDVRIVRRIDGDGREVVIVGTTPRLNPRNATHHVNLEDVHIHSTLGLMLVSTKECR